MLKWLLHWFLGSLLLILAIALILPYHYGAGGIRTPICVTYIEQTFGLYALLALSIALIDWVLLRWLGIELAADKGWKKFVLAQIWVLGAWIYLLHFLPGGNKSAPVEYLAQEDLAWGFGLIAIQLLVSLLIKGWMWHKQSLSSRRQWTIMMLVNLVLLPLLIVMPWFLLIFPHEPRDSKYYLDSQMARLSRVLETYYSYHDSYPVSIEALQAEKRVEANWQSLLPPHPCHQHSFGQRVSEGPKAEPQRVVTPQDPTVPCAVVYQPGKIARGALTQYTLYGYHSDRRLLRTDNGLLMLSNAAY
ncbi:MAG: hypothetical protein ACAI44_07260 [Candidatus Sericytochromatia bacterium]